MQGSHVYTARAQHDPTLTMVLLHRRFTLLVYRRLITTKVIASLVVTTNNTFNIDEGFMKNGLLVLCWCDTRAPLHSSQSRLFVVCAIRVCLFLRDVSAARCTMRFVVRSVSKQARGGAGRAGRWSFLSLFWSLHSWFRLCLLLELHVPPRRLVQRSRRCSFLFLIHTRCARRFAPRPASAPYARSQGKDYK